MAVLNATLTSGFRSQSSMIMTIKALSYGGRGIGRNRIIGMNVTVEMLRAAAVGRAMESFSRARQAILQPTAYMIS